MPFPSRTAESDLYAYLVVKHLGSIRGVPKNYMVAVVTTAGGRVYVAPSGGGDSIQKQGGALPEFLRKSSWWTDLAGAEMGKNKLKKTRKKADKGDAEATEAVGAHGRAVRAREDGTHVSYDTQNADITSRLTAALPSQTSDGVTWDTARGRRDCAEPRALEMAASAGEKITGMTTVWYGEATHKNYTPYVDDRDFADVSINAALPCAICQANEARIMAEVDARTLAPTGAPFRGLQRRHSIG